MGFCIGFGLTLGRFTVPLAATFTNQTTTITIGNFAMLVPTVTKLWGIVCRVRVKGIYTKYEV